VRRKRLNVRVIEEKDWPEFRKLWSDRNMLATDIAFRFGVCVSYCYDNASKMGAVSRNRTGMKVAPKEDVTPEEVEARKKLVWQRHLDDMKNDRLSYRVNSEITHRECYVIRDSSRGMTIRTGTTNN